MRRNENTKITKVFRVFRESFVHFVSRNLQIYKRSERSHSVQLNSIEDIGRHHRHIYLAPHFDDAVMSCGGSIAFQRMAGPQVLAITIFGSAGKSGSALTPFATQLQRETGLGSTAEEAIARRKEEDAAACNLLDADY